MGLMGVPKRSHDSKSRLVIVSIIARAGKRYGRLELTLSNQSAQIAEGIINNLPMGYKPKHQKRDLFPFIQAYGPSQTLLAASGDGL